ncbi:MAG TPA: aminotransferase class V-fold PLP-dependent enzyme [Kofleriaceae bacterium]|jgi:aromatic-L-amino-acid decarboxylase|nr:aminotransferase class V-fold PLP-dependent enzyme [Kofleriaceae bacterium]
MDAEQFRQLGHALVDWIAGYRETLESRAVMSQVRPGDIKAQFPSQPPEHGGATGDLIARLEASVLPGITHWNHPGFFAYFPSNTSYASILGDLVCAGLGVQGMSWQTSPAATEIEEVVMDWLRQMVGLSTAWTGVIQDTASTATLGALICAREKTLGFAPSGLQHAQGGLTVYASADAHSSIEKATVLAGFGKAHLRLIPIDDHRAIRVDALADAIARDRAAGLRPCAVVATIGTTNTTAFDPLEAIAEVTQPNAMWLHVDAAMAGTAMIAPECRPLWHGIERADSLVMNPHKWMGAGFDLSAYYCRDPQHLIRVMGTNPAYLRTQHDGEVANFRDWHIQLGRRFRALKLWFYILDQGVDGIRARLRRDLANAQWLAREAAATPGWQLVAPVALQTVCLRHVPAGLDESAVSARNLAIAHHINQTGRAYLTPSLVDGKQFLRISIGAERTEHEHVAALWSALCEAARVV